MVIFFSTYWNFFSTHRKCNVLELVDNYPCWLEELQAQLLRERKAHEKEIKRLEKELAVEKLYGLANKTMIDLAEKKYNIRIRKNSAAK